MTLGEYTANLAWTIETWGGHPDLFFFLRSWHSKFYQPSGEHAAGSNSMRWKNPELDRIIESIQQISFDDPKGIELGQEFVKLAAQEMPITPLMAYNVFTVCDETYFEGFPTIGESLYESCAELGQHQVHVRQGQAKAGITLALRRSRRELIWANPLDAMIEAEEH